VDGSDGRSLAWAQQRGYEEVDLRVELVRPLVAPGVADWPSSGLSAAPVDELLDELQLRPPVVNRPRPRRADGVAGLAAVRDGALDTRSRQSFRPTAGAGSRSLERACIGWTGRRRLRELMTWTQAGNESMQAVNARAGFVSGAVPPTLEPSL
jgi:hypothetical protein